MSDHPDSSHRPTVDVVIVQYGVYEFLFKCLRSIEQASEQPDRVFVIVNGIRDASTDQIQKDYPSVVVVVNPENWGYPRAANQGLRLSTARYVVLLNNDVVVDRDWLRPLIQTAADHPEAALVQPKVLSSIDPQRFDYAGAAGGYIDGYGYPCARGRVFETLEKDSGQYDDPCELFWASGAALLIDRQAALDIGAFDENLFIFHEESDLSWRLHLSGRTAWSSPRAKVFHYGSASFKESQRLSRLQYYMMNRNDFLMLIKNWGPRELRFRLPVRLLLELTSWPYLALRNPTQLREAVRALGWIFTNSRQIRAMRKRTQLLRTHPDSSYQHLMVRGILPLRYYLARETTMAKLDRYPPART